MTGGSAVWSSRRKAVLLFEGSRTVETGDVKAIVQTAVREYDTTIGQWKTFDACAVECNGSSSADAGNNIESSPEEKSHMGVIVGAGVGAIVVMMVYAVAIGRLVQKRRRDRKAAERDARTTALLSDGEDHYSHRRRTVHKRTANANRGNSSNENNMVMTAAERYAAKAAVELRAARDAAIAAAIAVDGRESSNANGDRRANSWISNTFSQVMASEYESTILINVDKVRRLSDATTAVTTAVGSVKIGLQQSDRVPRNSHSTPNEKNEAETLFGGSSSSTVGDRSHITAASAEKGVSFVKRGSSSSILPTSVRRAPSSVVDSADSDLATLNQPPHVSNSVSLSIPPLNASASLLINSYLIKTSDAMTPTARSLLSPPFSLLLFLFFTTLSLNLNTQSVHAQSPTLRRRSAYTVYNNHFYIHGGILPNAKTGSNEFNSLNLATAWPTTAAPWTTLPTGKQVWHHAMVAIEPKFSAGIGSGTQGYILSVGGTPANGQGFWSAFDIQTKQWKNVSVEAADISFVPYDELEGHTATVDPTTGLVYVIGGFDGMYSNALLPETANLLSVYDPNTGKLLSQERATTANSLTGANAIWSTERGTVMLLGGSRAVETVSVVGLDMSVLTEYSPSRKTWTSMTTSGAIPQARLDACSAVSDDGTKVIVYGGAADANTFLNSIHILNVTSGIWTAGPPSTGVLSQATCAFHLGMFIVFEGSIAPNDMNSLTGTTPLIFDVVKGSWTTSFTPSAETGGVTSPSRPNSDDAIDSSDSSASGDTSKLGVIIGAIAGAIVFLLIALGVYLVHRRRKLAREKVVRDTEARAVAMLAAEEKQKKESGPKVMTAADHYAAAQAALEEASKRLRPSAFKSPKSWISEANTNSVTDGSISTDFSKARRLSDPEVQADPALCYQQLLLKQRQLQMQHPHLIGGHSLRSPHSCAAGDHDGGSDNDCSSTSSSRRNSTDSRTGDKKRRLKIKIDQLWVPPEGIEELIVSPTPSSPQDWSGGSNIVNNQHHYQPPRPLTRSMTQRINSWDLDLTPLSARGPHAVVRDLKVEHISPPAPSLLTKSSSDSSASGPSTAAPSASASANSSSASADSSSSPPPSYTSCSQPLITL
ncbi:hypothetical protein BGZ47_007263 [Haplosporangium gracile]|nr:hypothetical protein BGZ47_007263 [Haplosporangium gracile]